MFQIETFRAWIKEQHVIHHGTVVALAQSKKANDFILLAKDRQTAELVRQYYLKDLEAVHFDFNSTQLVKVGAAIRVIEFAAADSTILYIETEAKMASGAFETVSGYIPAELTKIQYEKLKK